MSAYSHNHICRICTQKEENEWNAQQFHFNLLLEMSQGTSQTYTTHTKNKSAQKTLSKLAFTDDSISIKKMILRIAL